MGQQGVDQIPDGLLQVSSDLVDCLPRLEFVFSGQGDDEDADVQGLRRWVHTRMWAIRACLLALETEGPREEVLRLASLVWLYTLAPTGRRMTAQTIARRLKEDITLAGKAICGFSGDLHRWMLVVGALGSVGNAEERRWFIRRSIDTYQSLHPDSRSEGLSEQDLKSTLS